jgi:hypothetical protein
MVARERDHRHAHVQRFERVAYALLPSRSEAG